MNLVGPATLPASGTATPGMAPSCCAWAPDAQTWADLGAGAGFPGLVLAILRKGARPHPPRGGMAKRCRFLSEVVTALDLPATVVNERGRRT
jgi:16S rRNA (guanine527-N7)-methyltransferase